MNTDATTNVEKQFVLSIKSACYNKHRCYNKHGRTVCFINKIRMLQRTQMLQRTWKNSLFYL